MVNCHNEKECQQYLSGELELTIEPPITEKPECDFIMCPIFLELEKISYSKFLQSPLWTEIDNSLSKQATENAKAIKKVLTKTEMVKK